MLGSVWQEVPLERMREQKVLIIFTTSSMKRYTARFSPQGPWEFTLPNLDGSLSSHSFVLSIQGVESDQR